MFFDPVDVNLPLDYSPPYKFITDSIVESACSAKVHENKFTDLELYKGKTQCCELIRSILEYWTLEGIPNWQWKGPVEYCNRVGPFSNQEDFSSSGIIIRSFQCFEFDENSDINISATIGVVPEVDNTERSGLGSVREDQNTMWIQGKWRKASPESVLERKNSKSLGNLIRWHLFKYPWKGIGRSRGSFYVLGRDLSVHSTIASSGVNSNTMMNLDIIATDKFVEMDLSDTSYGFNYAG
ncbi:hypothetical protein SUGI_0734600 [Cryptomeria japonica]|nr:hypothetical protein SUGI_0734600 [Cryptomeria japonica]